MMDARFDEAHNKLEALFQEYPDVFGPGTAEDYPDIRQGDWIVVLDWHDLEDPDRSFYTYQLERHAHKHDALGLLYEGLDLITTHARLSDEE